MDVDKLYKKLGAPGRYHVIIHILICFSCWTPVSHNHLAMAFYGSVLPHRCAIPTGYALNESVPAIVTVSGEAKFNSCYAYDNFTRGSDNRTVKCPNGWDYTLPSSYPMEKTIVTEFNLVCDQAYLKNLATTIYFLGVMVGGLVFGQLADKWGRKPSLLTSLFLPIAIGGSLYFVQNYILFVVFRFILGVLMQGIQTCSFVMVAELFIPAHRSVTGPVTEVFWSIAGMLLALIAYLLRDWHYIQLAISLPSILFIFFIWVLPESPRWLVANKKYDTAKSFFKTAAKFNNVQLSDEDLIEQKNEQTRVLRTYTALDLVRTPNLRKRSCILFFIWFCISLGYYGLTFSISTLAGNKYLNFFIASAIELPAYIIATALITKFGRKGPLIFYLVLGGLLCIITPFIPETADGMDLTMVRTGLALGGRDAVASCFAVMFLYTSELFPTYIRNLGVGVCAFWTRVGGVVAPQILLLGTVSFRELPIVIFGSTLLIGAVLAIFLPETLGKTLPDTIEEAEMIGIKAEKTDELNGIDNVAITEENTQL